ncbi:hypothetical protein ABER99_20290 [Paenibacillus glucanolyticus]|uniref:hypothetical protein n=1 Tax=Paenibacillus TaxID=44249 RepID=UPI000FD9E18D|nr:hypothetical protein [Paenibacillus glucanolyticus]
MDQLSEWRSRHYDLKIQLLRLSKKIVTTTHHEDVIFYQELCEIYARHIKKIESDCFDEIGVSICNCGFHPEQCIE